LNFCVFELPRSVSIFHNNTFGCYTRFSSGLSVSFGSFPGGLHEASPGGLRVGMLQNFPDGNLPGGNLPDSGLSQGSPDGLLVGLLIRFARRVTRPFRSLAYSSIPLVGG
jgi:hypothetical protein